MSNQAHLSTKYVLMRILVKAIRLGHIGCLRRAAAAGLCKALWYSSAQSAIAWNRFECLRIALAAGCTDRRLAYFAACNSDPKSLRYVCRLGLPRDASTLRSAASGWPTDVWKDRGAPISLLKTRRLRLACVRFLRDDDCPEDQRDHICPILFDECCIYDCITCGAWRNRRGELLALLLSLAVGLPRVVAALLCDFACED